MNMTVELYQLQGNLVIYANLGKITQDHGLEIKFTILSPILSSNSQFASNEVTKIIQRVFYGFLWYLGHQIILKNWAHKYLIKGSQLNHNRSVSDCEICTKQLQLFTSNEPLVIYTSFTVFGELGQFTKTECGRSTQIP